MANPKVSVIIPTYNRSVSLKNTLEALSKQSYKDFEIIVVDDGSTDRTEEVVKEYKKVIYLKQRNSGPAKARNKGAKIAKGEILAFTDDDCFPTGDWIKNVLAEFTKEISGIEGMTISYDETSPLSYPTLNKIGGKYSTCNIFYRKKVFEEVGGFDENFPRPFYEDTDLAWRILKKMRKIKFVPSVVVIHPTNKYGPIKFLKKHIKDKIPYLDVYLAKKHSKYYREKQKVFMIFSLNTILFYPFYAALIFLIIKPNILTLVLLVYVYTMTTLLHNLFLTKGDLTTTYKNAGDFVKVLLIWWIAILLDTIYRIAGIIRYGKILL